MPLFSVIIPVYNRPEEIRELLSSLEKQKHIDFEVIIIEDGSTRDCKSVVDAYQDSLNISYHFKENSGQGFSRNIGADLASGKWLVFFDSDCIIPEDYFQNLSALVDAGEEDAYCGPDAASADFSNWQKAISYSMTSFLTTGGIRGKKNKSGKGQLRSYNMVVSVSAYKALGGFSKTNMGEDMEFSYRFHDNGYSASISSRLAVFHKRRNSLTSFFRQIFSFGRTRVLLKRDYGIPIKIIHSFPLIFFVGFLVSVVLFNSSIPLFKIGLAAYGLYFLAILIDSSLRNKSVIVGLLSMITSFVQHSAYGLGMIKESTFPEKQAAS